VRKGDGSSPATGGSTALPVDAAAAIADAAAPTIPTGMLLVNKRDGSTFYSDAQAVSLEAYRQVFSKHEQTSKPDDPVVNLSYTEAKSYALTRGARLLTSEEWDAAAVTPGFVVGDGLYEWVDSPDEKKRTVRVHGKTATRPDQKQNDVTFRTARNP
jgi:formylglycine-generating enzyme required for sulfatase activity